jgi:hypothetical protein
MLGFRGWQGKRGSGDRLSKLDLCKKAGSVKGFALGGEWD